MKKILTLLVATTMLICAFSLVAFAIETEYVAYIGETPYATLQDAITESKDGDTITLNTDAELTDQVLIPGEVGQSRTLDLNEKTLTLTGSSTGRVIFVKKGIITIKNGTIINNSTTYAIGCEASSKYDRISTVNLEDLTVNCTSTGGFVTLGTGTLTTHTLNITNLNVTCPNALLYSSSSNNSNTVNMYSGNIKGDFSEKLNAPNVNIYGGTFTVTPKAAHIADGYVIVENDNGTYTVKKTPEKVTEAVSTASYDDGKNANTVTKRFFVTIDSDQYAEAGFEITVDDYTFEIALDEIYSAVSVNGTEYVVDEGYILTGAIGDVPNDFNGDFVVKAYTVSFTGEKTYIAE